MELVDSVDDLRSSSSIRSIPMPDFEVLDARIASALNKIIHNSHFKRKISLEEQKAQKQDRFLRGRQIAYLIYDHFRVTGSDDSVENYTDLFTIVLRNDDIQEFDSKWDGILLSMTKIPPDDILEGLYKLRIRESDKLKTVLELYDLETHQKKLGPDNHRLKAMVKRSIEQEIRNKNFGARSGRLRILSCSRVSENHRGPEVPEVKAPVVECRDGLARITSKELAITHPAKNGILLNACSTRTRMVAVFGRSAHSHTVRLMNSRRSGPNRIMAKRRGFIEKG